MAEAAEHEPIKAYWQPGCTSCLRMKEFLTRHGVPFQSINVLEDADGLAELARLGVRSVPIVQKGTDWANGQVLRDVARVAGIAWGGVAMLPVPELYGRLVAIQTAGARLFAQIPEDRVGEQLPNRPRSYAELAYHIFNIADAWLEHEVQGQRLEEGAYNRVPAAGEGSKGHVLAYGARVLAELEAWWAQAGRATDYGRQADVYYGQVSLHEYLERTTWHSGQHVRQLAMVLGNLGIAPDGAPGREVFDGLPMPEGVWDAEG
ncbi:MAG: glutaredoxin domain-containing protein [Hyphomicrobiaceae bacterium]|nr:glutaredoxin domain-containing protein [Hyphomicrobiaceae bacterium]